MKSGHLVVFSTSGKFITKFNVLRCISLSETLFWTGTRGGVPITLTHKFQNKYRENFNVLVDHDNL